MISSLFSQFSRLIVSLWSCKMVTSLRPHLRLLFTLINAGMFIKLPGCCWQPRFLLSKRSRGKCCLNWLKSFLFVVLKHVAFYLQPSVVGQCKGHRVYFSVLEVVLTSVCFPFLCKQVFCEGRHSQFHHTGEGFHLPEAVFNWEEDTQTLRTLGSKSKQSPNTIISQ